MDGYTDKSIFLPAAGDRYDSSLHDAGSGGYYWSSSLSMGRPDLACVLLFYSSFVISDYGGRWCGRSVRPVCP